MPYPLIFLALLICWLYAEFNLARIARIASGVLCMIMLGFTINYVALVIPTYESSFHKSDIQLVATLLAEGKTQRVQEALRAYTNKAATSTTYGASMEMWNVLNNGPKK